MIAWGGGGAVYVYLCDLCCLVGMVYSTALGMLDIASVLGWGLCEAGVLMQYPHK